MTVSWFVLASVATAAFGVQDFLFKVAADRRCSTGLTTFSFMLTVALLACIGLAVLGAHVPDAMELVGYSAVNAITFLILTVCRMEALKVLAVSVVLPLLRMSTVLVVLYGVVVLKEPVSAAQTAGLVLAFVAVQLAIGAARQDTGREPGTLGRGMGLSALAVLAGAGTVIVTKHAAVHVDHLAYIVLSYSFNALVVRRLFRHMDTPGDASRRLSLVLGSLIGVSNAVGFFVILLAFRTQPLSIVAAITSLSFVLSVALSMLFLKERLTWRRAAGVVVAATAVVLLRAG